MRNVFQLNWINLVAYVVIEQLFLATFRRLDYRLVGYIPLIASAAEVWMQRNQAALITAEQKEVTSFGVKRVMIDFLNLETVVQTVVDAAINVAVLVLAINISNPARPNLPLFEFGSLSVIFGGYALLEYGHSAEYPIKAFLFTGSWEQARLLSSFLFLRIAAGALLQAIVFQVSKQSELRIEILRSNCDLDLEKLSLEAKPKPKFAANVNVALILFGAAVTVATGVVGVIFVALVKTRDAFAVYVDRS
jgi:hypothetical protein